MAIGVARSLRSCSLALDPAEIEALIQQLFWKEGQTDVREARGGFTHFRSLLTSSLRPNKPDLDVHVGLF